MADIRISDLGIATVTDPDASLAGYLLQTLRLVIAPGGGQALAGMIDRPLKEVDLAGFHTGFMVQESTGIGNGGLEWNILGGANAQLGIWNHGGETVLSADHFGPDTALKVPPGGAYVSYALRGQLGTGPSVQHGDLTFGVTAGASIEAAYYQPLTETTSLRDGLTSTLQDFVIPGDLKDLAKLAPGAAACIRGSGRVEFSVSGSLSVVPNPLAVSIPVINRPLGVQAGASAGFSATAAFIGEYEVRVVGLGPKRVSLGLYRIAGASFDIAVTATAGVSAGIGGTDLAGTIIGAIAGRPDVDRDFLRHAGLSDSRIDDMRDTVRAAVNRKLETSLELGFGALKSSGPAFLFTLDLAALDAASSRAVKQALGGDLRAITAGELAGVRLERSVANETVKKSSRFRVNLFGIFNYDSLFEMVRKGREVYDPATGELLFLDEATANRRETALDNTKQIPTERVAKLMADTMLIALSFAATVDGKTEAALHLEHWHFKYQRDGKSGDVKDRFDVAASLGLAEPGDSAPFLALPRFGRLALLAETAYDAQTARSIFLDSSDAARPREYFESAGRRAVSLLEGGDEDDAARAILGTNDEVFGKLVEAGSHQAALAALARVTVNGDAIPVPVQEAMYSDYLAIEWWADSMVSLAQKLSELQALRKKLPGNVTPDADNAYRKLRKELQDRLADVVSRTKPMFGEPWGLVAMYLASDSRAGAHVRITSDEFQFDNARGWS